MMTPTIAGIRLEFTPQVVVTSALVIFASHWLWKNYLSGTRLTSSFEGRSENNGKPLTSRSRLLDELNPLPHDMELKEELEEEHIENIDQKSQDSRSLDNELDNNTVIESNNDNQQSQSNDATDTANLEPSDSEMDRPTTSSHPNPPLAETVESISSTTSTTPTAFANKSHEHPGLSNFWYWCDTEASLFRVYNLGRVDGTDVVPPYIPRSRAGTVQVHMKVTNRCSTREIEVFWITYKGNETSKGVIRPGRSWTQFSWIEHPWVFRDHETQQILLHYIPDRIIPSTALDMTTDQEAEDVNTGVHRFEFRDAEWGSPFLVSLHDPVLPFPAENHITTTEDAVRWTIRHMLRVTEARNGMVTDWNIISQYFYNILRNPQNPKYRRIRIANPVFAYNVWNGPARGLFYAAGFVEQGAYAELGAQGKYPMHLLKALSEFVMLLEQWKRQWPQLSTGAALLPQPDGADGSGRAGFGVAGSNAFAQ